MSRYADADEQYADLPSRADLINEDRWDEINRERLARERAALARSEDWPPVVWDDTYDPPPF